MEFAILTVMMLLVTGVLMCYVGYLNSTKKDHLQQQLELVEEEIDKCDARLSIVLKYLERPIQQDKPNETKEKSSK